MRTTLDINPELVERVLAETGEKSKGRAVDRAMEEFLRRRAIERLLAARGTFDLVDNLEELEALELEEMKKQSW